jgi:hypothetical protein
MVRLFLVVQVPHACDQWPMAVMPRPLDCFVLCFEGCEHVVHMVLDSFVFEVSTPGEACSIS